MLFDPGHRRLDPPDVVNLEKTTSGQPTRHRKSDDAGRLAAFEPL